MSRRAPIVAVVVGLLTFAPAAAVLAVEQVAGESGLGTPLAHEMIADERPPPATPAPDATPPDATAPLAARPPAAADSLLLDIPLRTRFPSRVFLPGLPEVGLAPPGSSLADTDETQLVQLVYDTYSRYSERADGERVEFELDRFRTVYRPQFGRVAHYPDLMTLHPEWEIETTVREHRLNGEVLGTWFDAEWLPGRSGADEAAVERELVGRSVLEILALGVDQQPERRRTIAITSYRVRVSYLGRTETYRAAVRWRLDENQALQFSVTDNLVPEVAFAMAEQVPPLRGERPRAAVPFEAITGASTSPSCLSKTWQPVYSTQEARYNSAEHVSGRHEAVFIGKYVCRCDDSCNQWCDPGHHVDACQDYGTLSHHMLRHETAKKSPIDSGTSGQGHQTAARCASGFGCFVQSCHDGACGSMSVTVSAGFLSFSFSTDRPTVLEASLTNNHTCPLCLEQEPPPEEPTPGTLTPEVDDGGSGGTGTGTTPTEGSPIVIDLDRGGFRFTALAGGVRFDLDGDGAAEAISWVAPGSGDAWLALDRDGDGAIGSGAELFGDYTPQPPAAEPHGYLALAVFDAPAQGGDGDGAITAADAVFPALRLWIDADHDGVSQPGELRSLAAAGVRALDLDFVESRRRDPHGNQLRYTSRVDLDHGTTQATDVFLLVGRCG